MDRTTYFRFFIALNLLYCIFSKFLMVTQKWNPALKAGAGSSSCEQKSQNSLTLNYSLWLTILSMISSRKCHLFFQANSMAACNRACTVEAEFLCRSFLFLGPPTGTEYNCKLYHMDHWSLPEGMDSFLNSNVPTTIADGSRIGNFYENRCERK